MGNSWAGKIEVAEAGTKLSKNDREAVQLETANIVFGIESKLPVSEQLWVLNKTENFLSQTKEQQGEYVGTFRASIEESRRNNAIGDSDAKKFYEIADGLSRLSELQHCVTGQSGENKFRDLLNRAPTDNDMKHVKKAVNDQFSFVKELAASRIGQSR